MLKNEDYDFYTIPFSFKNLIPRNRTRYIYSELDKLHPCFSDDCCFDSRLRLEKSGLKADVVVMQKYKLAEYKNQNKKIIITERKSFPFFDSHKNKVILFCMILFLAAGTIGNMIFNNHKRNLDVSIEKPVSVQQPEPLFSCKDFLDRVSQLNGKINSFIWSSDGYKENLVILLKGIYPEQLELAESRTNNFTAKFSSVVYEQQLPVFTASFSFKNILQEEALPQKSDIYRKGIRELAVQNEIQILEETITPYSLSLVAAKNQQQAFEKMIGFLLQNDLFVSEINISKANQLKLTFCFSEIQLPSQKALYECLLQNAALFCNDEIPTGKESLKKTTAVINSQSDAFDVKLGQLIKSDGSIVEYFKENTGKIKTRIKEVQNE